MYHVYILYSKGDDRYYIGHTGDDLATRLKKHLSNHKGYTSRCKDWEIAYVEEYDNKPDAYRRELELKSWKSKKRITQLVQTSSEHPAL